MVALLEECIACDTNNKQQRIKMADLPNRFNGSIFPDHRWQHPRL